MPNGDPLDFSDQYNTQLSPQDEAAYQAWAQQNNRARDVYDYDVRGWWKSGAAIDDRNHGTDQFKKPNHPTFSDESQYHGVNGMQGGHWNQQPDGSFDFTPGGTNMYTTPQLQNYFKRVEPGNELNVPPT
jgi:hypothetical protein